MTYKLILKKPAKKFIKKLDSHIQKRLIKSLKEIMKNPMSGIPLMGNLKGLRKKRCGNYRIIHQIISEKILIYILDINHRKNIYK